MTDDQRAQLESHLDHCAAHARAMQRLEAGQRAYDRPPKIPLPPRIAEQIIAALVTAAPVKALGGDADAVRARALQHLEVVSAPTPAPARVPPAAAAQATPSAPAAAPPAAAARPGPFAPGDVAPAPATQAAPFLPAEAPPAPVIDVAPPAANEAGPRDMPAHVATPAAAGPAQTPAAPAMPQGGNGRSLRGRAARLAVAERQAAIAERLAIARHRVLGPSRGSVERRGALRSQLKRRSTDPPVGRSAPAAGATREAELTAIALFVSVAAIVATVTFLAAPGL
ncbi:MAG TPA: hypothetical protein VGV90_15920 [Solirubrobacteraceae bacterium]|nr:hypothetical protein [Solirubrobacteraceae bacterium]